MKQVKLVHGKKVEWGNGNLCCSTVLHRDALGALRLFMSRSEQHDTPHHTSGGFFWKALLLLLRLHMSFIWSKDLETLTPRCLELLIYFPLSVDHWVWQMSCAFHIVKYSVILTRLLPVILLLAPNFLLLLLSADSVLSSFFLK